MDLHEQINQLQTFFNLQNNATETIPQQIHETYFETKCFETTETNICQTKFEEIRNNDEAPFQAYENSFSSTTINCKGCGIEINERQFICLNKRNSSQQNNEQLEKQEKNLENKVKENSSYWHENCLRCAKCNKNFINENDRCFVRDERIFCPEDYYTLYGPNASCTRCGLKIIPRELVYRSKGIYIYHLNCFVCFCCGQQLKLGEQYINFNGQLICQKEIDLWRLQQQQQQNPQFLSIPTFPEFNIQRQQQYQHHHHNYRRHRDRSKKIPKRPRTILNGPQRKAFKYAFDKGQKPSRKVREQLARETGLSIRVVQVWFQNQRAKIKKESNKQEYNNKQNNSSIEGSLDYENNGNENNCCSSAEEEIMDDSDESIIDSSEEEDDDKEEKEKIIENNIEVDEQEQNPIEKLYNMHQTYFAFV